MPASNSAVAIPEDLLTQLGENARRQKIIEIIVDSRIENDVRKIFGAQSGPVAAASPAFGMTWSTPDCLVTRIIAGYPSGPLEWGDALGAATVHSILEGLLTATGDPRYRPTAWLIRRARLGLSLAHTD